MNDGAQNNGAATPPAGTPPTAEPNDLDSLIKEFDDGTKPIGKLLRAIQPVVVEAEQRQIRERQERFTKDMNEAAEEFKKIPGAENRTIRELRGFMRDYAADTPEIEQAFNNRENNPDAWKSARERVKAALVEELKTANPPNTLRADTEAARASVRNSSQTPIPTPELSLTEKANMSDSQWNQYMRGKIAAAQRR
jgi:hypothetical protein